MIEQINETTYGFRMPSGDLVEVGDRETSKFHNHLKLNRWDGECFICPSIEQTGKTKLRVQDNLIESESNLSIIRSYPIAPSKQWELGSFRMEITHKKKPPTNKVLSSILSHNVKAFYQPPLTQEEIEEGAVRPNNIIGSYAFYHATRSPMHASKAIADKYRCCKVGHKPRPRIIDDNGDWCWAELSIDLKTGLQIITIPQEFLEYAKYPIRHDAGADTFGYTSLGTGWTPMIEDVMSGGVFAGAAGDATSITIYITVDSGTGTLEHKCALYTTDDALVGTTEEDVYDVTGGSAWRTLNFSPSVSISAVDYAIMGFGNQSGDYIVKMQADAGAVANGRWYKNQDYGASPNYPNPYDGSKYSNWTNVSIYCTYTPGAPPEGWSNIASVMGVGQADIASFKGAAKADIASIKGAAV